MLYTEDFTQGSYAYEGTCTPEKKAQIYWKAEVARCNNMIDTWNDITVIITMESIDAQMKDLINWIMKFYYFRSNLLYLKNCRPHIFFLVHVPKSSLPIWTMH